jgi:hypothetical protein
MATTRKTKQAEILREYGPYPGIDNVHGVTFDGAHVWFARGPGIVAVDPVGGAPVRELAVVAESGTAFDGKYLWQLAQGRIQKVDPRSGEVVATIPAPAHGGDSGLTSIQSQLAEAVGAAGDGCIAATRTNQARGRDHCLRR